MIEGNLTLRIADPHLDAAALLAIYNPYVRETAITFEYDTPTEQDFFNRIENTLKQYPYLVAELDGKPCGYAYAGCFKARAAYQYAVETSIYLIPQAQGKGIGRILYDALEKVLLAQNVYNVNACIAALPQPQDRVAGDYHLTDASVLFHQKLGYSLVGRFHQCAYKFDRWYDMVWMEKMLEGRPGVGEIMDSLIPFPQVDAAFVEQVLRSAVVE